MNEFFFFKLVRNFVTPSEIEGGDYQLLIQALLPLDKTDIHLFSSLLEQHIDKILPEKDEYDKEDLLYVPDVVIVMQGATIRQKGSNVTVPLTDIV